MLGNTIWALLQHPDQQFTATLAQEMARIIPGRQVCALPGVLERLTQWRARSDVLLGLLTGNTHASAPVRAALLAMRRRSAISWPSSPWSLLPNALEETAAATPGPAWEAPVQTATLL